MAGVSLFSLLREMRVESGKATQGYLGKWLVTDSMGDRTSTWVLWDECLDLGYWSKRKGGQTISCHAQRGPVDCWGCVKAVLWKNVSS